MNNNTNVEKLIKAESISNFSASNMNVYVGDFSAFNSTDSIPQGDRFDSLTRMAIDEGCHNIAIIDPIFIDLTAEGSFGRTELDVYKDENETTDTTVYRLATFVTPASSFAKSSFSKSLYPYSQEVVNSLVRDAMIKLLKTHKNIDAVIIKDNRTVKKYDPVSLGVTIATGTKFMKKIYIEKIGVIESEFINPPSITKKKKNKKKDRDKKKKNKKKEKK